MTKKKETRQSKNDISINCSIEIKTGSWWFLILKQRKKEKKHWERNKWKNKTKMRHSCHLKWAFVCFSIIIEHLKWLLQSCYHARTIEKPQLDKIALLVGQMIQIVMRRSGINWWRDRIHIRIWNFIVSFFISGIQRFFSSSNKFQVQWQRTTYGNQSHTN